MERLLVNLQHLLFDGWEVLISVLLLVLPWTPLIAWIAFWLLAVNWKKLYPVLAQGGAVGVFLIGMMMILIWGLIAPPPDGVHRLLGLHTANFVGKTVYVTMLLTIAALCGSIQLSGSLGTLTWFAKDDEQPHETSGHGHGDHGHDADGGHDTHSSHGH